MGVKGGGSNLLHGNGPPAADTVRFTFRHLLLPLWVRALSRLEEKRQRSVRDRGTGDGNARPHHPQRAARPDQTRPDQTRPLSPRPGLPAHGAASVSPVPSRDTPAPASPAPVPWQAVLSPHNCKQSCPPSRMGLPLTPLPQGHTGHGDRQKWHGMQVEHGWKQERLRQ